MNDLIALYGTAVPPTEGERFQVGDLSFTFEDGALRHIRLNGAEILRGMAFLVRDCDWGTLEPRISNETVKRDLGSLSISYDAVFSHDDAELVANIRIDAGPERLIMSAECRATGAFVTNRAGFTVLHPIEGVAGAPVSVEHGDGTVERTCFPVFIEPWQPFKDIAAITHHSDGKSITCRFHGDTFEMEDQRQWGDASFKTYVRPLALPWPYTIENGASVAQSVELSWANGRAAAMAAPDVPEVTARFPECAIVITPDEAARLARNPSDLDAASPQRVLCHVDATRGDVDSQFRAFADVQAELSDLVFDLELICDFAGDVRPELERHAQSIEAVQFRPDSVLVCPSVDRQSTPPGSDWPACPPLDEVHAVAADVFPDMVRGGGMVSLFTELNRKRPPVGMLDFVSHGLCPIVHASDDVSVMETLEAIPHITRSARNIIGAREYRIGPATIAMRQNPYGGRTIPNPARGRVCMTDDDPRHRAAFGAAYAIGLATALAPAGIAVWTPAALYGPRGLMEDGAPFPLAVVLRRLSDAAGEAVKHARISDGVAELHVGSVQFRANLTPQQKQDLPAYGWSHA